MIERASELVAAVDLQDITMGTRAMIVLVTDQGETHYAILGVDTDRETNYVRIIGGTCVPLP